MGNDFYGMTDLLCEGRTSSWFARIRTLKERARSRREREDQWRDYASFSPWNSVWQRKFQGIMRCRARLDVQSGLCRMSMRSMAFMLYPSSYSPRYPVMSEHGHDSPTVSSCSTHGTEPIFGEAYYNTTKSINCPLEAPHVLLREVDRELLDTSAGQYRPGEACMHVTRMCRHQNVIEPAVESLRAQVG